MRVGFYNCRGLRLGNTAGDVIRHSQVDTMLQCCDIVCLQETFLPKQDLGQLNCFNANFHGAGESTTDLTLGIVRGRIPGGVAILWHKKLDSVINVIRLDRDWCIAVECRINNKVFTILNVYTPYECLQNEDEYLNRLAFINSFIADNHSTSVYVVGDMNADLSDKNSLFAKHLAHFCEESNLLFSSQLLLPSDSYTYISEAWHTTSWLDHCLSTSDAHAILKSMEIIYDVAMSDHVPVVLVLDVDKLPELSLKPKTGCKTKLDWSKLSDKDVLSYFGRTNVLFNNIHLPYEAISCSNVNCKTNTHSKDLCTLYDCIVGALYEASRSLYKSAAVKNKVMPGWNKHVAAHSAEAKQAHKAWVLAGRPRQGPVLDHKKSSNAKYKQAVRYIRNHENIMKADSMADKLIECNVTGFWKEVRAQSRNNSILPSFIEGVSGEDNIAELWRAHYSETFNCVKSDPFKIENLANDSTVGVSTNEVRKAIEQLADNKACGADKITAEHLKHASPKVAVLLAICLTGLMTHGILPHSMLSVTLVPVIKDKAGKVGSVDNYRPIALASVMSKVVERVLLDRLDPFMGTTDNQYGFKAKHGTDLCIYALKEVVLKYRSQNSSMLVGFIDASRAFDRVCHYKLFVKLKERGVPDSIVRILAYWYANQSMQVRWGSGVSAPFSVSNGVRQGGLLSPSLFNLYMDDLSVKLNNCNTGCRVGNHLMYADDLALLSPSSAGFQQLLNVCTEYGIKYDV